MKNNWKWATEKGQSLVIVALVMIGLLAALALVLDGGMTFAYRRTAQAAADAGAMAGARQLCETGDANLAVSTALNYATTRNGATSADVVVDTAARTVDVTAHIPFNTFFAGLIGRSQINVQAEAMVGCANPSFGEGVLPVAWSCRWPISGPGTGACEQQTVTEDVASQRISAPGNVQPDGTIWPELYIVMDSFTTDDGLICVEDDPIAGNIICDLDGDGEINRMPSGDRSWLNLDGGSGNANELGQFIDGTREVDLQIISWLGGSTGTVTSAFSDAKARIGDIIILPVFDQFCDVVPDAPGCAAFYDPSHIIVLASGALRYYRIIGFSAFMITCVHSQGNDNCPGREAFRSLNSGTPGINSVKAIEGYFIEGYVPGMGGDGGYDAGVYNLLFRR